MESINKATRDEKRINLGGIDLFGPKNFLSPDFTPGINDVIFGGENKCVEHSGNKRFQSIVASKLEEYLNASTLKDKTSILLSIVSQVRMNNPKGGFIKFDPSVGMWHEVGNFSVREQVFEAFREAAIMNYRRKICAFNTIGMDSTSKLNYLSQQILLNNNRLTPKPAQTETKRSLEDEAALTMIALPRHAESFAKVPDNDEKDTKEEKAVNCADAYASKQEGLDNVGAPKKVVSQEEEGTDAADRKRTFFIDGGTKTFSSDFIPDSNDVLIGRGKKCFEHVGNKKFLTLVALKLDEYSAATTKKEKTDILMYVVSQVRTNSPNGGFLKLDERSGLWFVANDILAREKVSQVFRDTLHNDYRSSNEFKKKRKREKNGKEGSSGMRLSKRASMSQAKSFEEQEEIVSANDALIGSYKQTMGALNNVAMDSLGTINDASFPNGATLDAQKRQSISTRSLSEDEAALAIIGLQSHTDSFAEVQGKKDKKEATKQKEETASDACAPKGAGSHKVSTPKKVGSQSKVEDSASGDTTIDGRKRTFSPGFSPGSNDVLIGRGKKFFGHVGNKRLHNLVASKLEEYSAATIKKEKTDILLSIVSQVQTDSPDGGFIKLDEKSGLWFEVGDFFAREKVSQAFRDALSSEYRSSNEFKKKRLRNRKRNEHLLKLLSFHDQRFQKN